MNASRQDDPRANQKERTRAALVAAAGEMFRAGTAPTVAEAAERAKVSRATAYRYFPTQESLLVEIAAATPAVVPVESLLETLPAGDVEQRLLRLVDAINPIMLDAELPMRNALRVYLDTWLQARRHGQHAPAVRDGRRMRWLDTVLAPVRTKLTAPQWKRLRCALALTMGIDALVVAKDVCRLGDDEAIEMLRWAALALLRAGLSGESAPRRPAPAKVASRATRG